MLYDWWKVLMREGKTRKTSSHTIVLSDMMAIVQCIAARRKPKSCMYMFITFSISMHETKLRNSVPWHSILLISSKWRIRSMIEIFQASFGEFRELNTTYFWCWCWYHGHFPNVARVGCNTLAPTYILILATPDLGPWVSDGTSIHKIWVRYMYSDG